MCLEIGARFYQYNVAEMILEDFESQTLAGLAPVVSVILEACTTMPDTLVGKKGPESSSPQR